MGAQFEDKDINEIDRSGFTPRTMSRERILCSPGASNPKVRTQ